MLKLSTQSLASLRDSSQNLCIVGSGPTNFDYNFSTITDPIIFINDMVKFAGECASRQQYFVTHHLSKYRDVSPVTFWLYKGYFQSTEWNMTAECRNEPKNDKIAVKVIMGDIVHRDFFKENPFLLDKLAAIERNTILGFFGTVTTALYLSWFIGCRHPLMIGCNPETMGNEHDKRIGGAMIYEPDKIKFNQKELAEILELRPIYL